MASVASSVPEMRHRHLTVAASQANEGRVREILGEELLWASHSDREALRQALQKVAGRGHMGVARLLLERGADVEPGRENETAALFRAAEGGHTALVAELLAHGAKVNTAVPQREGQTALFVACLHGHADVVALLLEAGADVHVRDHKGRTALLFWVSEKPKEAAHTAGILRLLVEHGANVEARDPIGRTALLWAAINDNQQLVDALLDSDTGAADVGAVNNRGRSALHMTAELNLVDMVRLLLQRGADVDAVSDGGWTALHNAAQGGHAAVVQLLLEAGANVNVVLSNGMTALHWAAFNGYVDVVQLLLARDETNLALKDSFDRTPMLCAAERFHGTIVGLLSPAQAGGRLSAAARAACDEFKATIVDFGDFRDDKKHQVFKRSVYDVLYGWDEQKKKPTVATQTRNIKYQPQLRWIHLPANNIAWAETLLSKWFIEGGHCDIEPFKALEKCFDQEHRGPLAHAHFMRTFCSRIPSKQTTGLGLADADANATPSFMPKETTTSSASTAATAVSGGGEMSIRRQTTDLQSSDGTETAKRKGKGEQFAERHGRRAKRNNGPPGNPPGTKALRAVGLGACDVSKIPSANGIIVLFMPFLHYETDERRQCMSRAIEAVRKGYSPPEGAPRDELLLKGYLHHTPPVHPRRTLDQFFYHGIDTSTRDTDQVVYRYFERHKLEKKVYMVDQLWMWVLGKDLVVTCFPQRWDQPSRDPLNVVDGIIEDTNAKTRPPVQSVFDLAMLITNRCAGMFDRFRPADQEYQFLDMFESSIGLVTDRESELFRRFNRASAMSAEWLELHRRPGGIERHTSEPVFPDALLDIGTETSLLAEIKDIRDELKILLVILDAQLGSLQELESSIGEELRPEGGSAGRRTALASASVDSILAETRRRARDQKRLLETHCKDIERMDRQAESIYLSLTHLLDLKQKHSNALEARFARDHAMIAARQGQTIMTFTIVTILFLPMSFIAAFFSIQIQSWDGSLTLGYVSKYTFGIGLGISIPLIVMAFSVPDIFAAFSGLFRAGQKQVARLCRPEQLDQTVIAQKRPPSSITTGSAASKWRIQPGLGPGGVHTAGPTSDDLEKGTTTVLVR